MRNSFSSNIVHNARFGDLLCFSWVLTYCICLFTLYWILLFRRGSYTNHANKDDIYEFHHKPFFSSTDFVMVGVCQLFMACIWVECGVLITNLRNFCCGTFWPRLQSFKSGSELVTLKSPVGRTFKIPIFGHF